jgi:hypothetical protein
VAVGSLILESELAGAGDAVLARQPGLGRRVLLKSLRREALSDPRRFERFRREARIAASLAHPNVRQVFDLFAWQGDHYLVLEHVDGASLREWLDRLGRPPAEVAGCLLLELARGVEALHAAGIIHADLRPENVLIGRWGELKLAGLGCARRSGEVDVPGPDPGPRTAPELAQGAAPDAAADVFALGAIAAELAGPGALPRVVRSARHTMAGRRPTAAQLRRALERRARDSSPAAVQARVASWLLAAPVPAAGARAAERRVGSRSAARRRLLAPAAAGIAAALLVGWGWQRLQRPAGPPDVSAAPAPDAHAVETPAPPAVEPGERAYVRFAVFPWGVIRIDGGEPIVTPRAEPVALFPGVHRVEITHPTLGTERREIRVAARERRTLRHVFGGIGQP